MLAAAATMALATKRNAPTPGEAERVVLFQVAGQTLGLPLVAVERVVPAAAITPLPGAPAVIRGVVEVAGEPLPVLEMRQRLGFPSLELEPAHLFLVAQLPTRRVLLLVEQVLGLRTVSPEAVRPAHVVWPGLEAVPGVLTCPDGLVLIYDPARFFSLPEEHQLAQAVAAYQPAK